MNISPDVPGNKPQVSALQALAAFSTGALPGNPPQRGIDNRAPPGPRHAQPGPLGGLPTGRSSPPLAGGSPPARCFSPEYPSPPASPTPSIAYVDALLAELQGHPEQGGSFVDACKRLESDGWGVEHVDDQAPATWMDRLAGDLQAYQPGTPRRQDRAPVILPADISRCLDEAFSDGPPATVKQAQEALISTFRRNFSRVFVAASLARHYQARPIKGMTEPYREMAVAILAELRACDGRVMTADALALALEKRLGYLPSSGALLYCLRRLALRAGVTPAMSGDKAFSLGDDTVAQNQAGSRARARDYPLPRWGTCTDATNAVMKAIEDWDLYTQLFHADPVQYSSRPRVHALRCLLPAQTCVSDSLIGEVISAFYGVRENSKPKAPRPESVVKALPECRRKATDLLDNALVDAVTQLGQAGVTVIRHHMKNHYGPVSVVTLLKKLGELEEIDKSGPLYHLAGRPPVTTTGIRPDSKGRQLLDALAACREDFPWGMMSSKMIQEVADQYGIEIEAATWLSFRKNFFEPVPKAEAAAMLRSKEFHNSVFRNVQHIDGAAMYRLAAAPTGEKYPTLKALYPALMNWVRSQPMNAVIRQKDARKALGTTFNLNGLMFRLVEAGVVTHCQGGYQRVSAPVARRPAPQAREQSHVAVPAFASAGQIRTPVVPPTTDGAPYSASTIWPRLPQHLRTPYVAALLEILEGEHRVVQPLTQAQLRSAQEAGDIFETFDAAPQGGSGPVAARLHDERPIDRSHLRVLPNPGGGDCLLHALQGRQLSPGEALELRHALASQRARQPDDAASRTLNAENLALSLAMVDAELARNAAQGLTGLPNSSYAQVLALPGHYLGNDEIQHYCQLRDEGRPGAAPLTVAVLDAGGDLTVLTAAGRAVVAAASCSRQERLGRAMRADIVLYNSGQHYEMVTGLAGR